MPLATFVLIGILLYQGFSVQERHSLPSALRNLPFPEFLLPDLHSGEPIDRDRIVGRAGLVNVWATWCPTCLAEHAELQRISANFGVPIYGVNYKDDPDKARAWLQRYGDPYELTILDRDGLLGIELGVYGAPETFVINNDGVILHRRVGAVSEKVWTRELHPLLAPLIRDLAASAEHPQ